MRVLFICTANVCRSPLGSALMIEAAHLRGLEQVKVASAGFLEAGHPVHEHVTALLATRGVDVAAKTSQVVSEQVVAGADLILAMTTEHARRLVGAYPAALPKIWAFRQLMSVVTGRPHGVDELAWLARLDQAHPRNYAEDSAQWDVPDPIGEGREVFAGLADEMITSINWFLSCAYPNVAGAQR